MFKVNSVKISEAVLWNRPKKQPQGWLTLEPKF